MARKTAKALKSFPDLPWLVEKARAFQALSNEEKEVLRKIEATPTDPLLRTVMAYVRAEVEAIKAEKALDAIPMDDKRPQGLGKGVTWEDFQTALDASAKANHLLGRAVDAWQATARLVLAQEEHDADPANSNVPKETAKSLIAEALAESAIELQWNVNSVGLVAHKLTEAVYGFVVRDEAQEVPLCPACQ